MSKLSHVRIASARRIRDRSLNVGRLIPISCSLQKRPEHCLPSRDEAHVPGNVRRTRDFVLRATILTRWRAHSLRQCLIFAPPGSCLASEILSADREAISLRTQLLAVDARTFVTRAIRDADELTRAVTLWHGAFLPELTLDIEAFDVWHRQEAERLVTAAAVFEALCGNTDANGDGESAITAAEQLVALEPTRKDRQRTR